MKHYELLIEGYHTPLLATEVAALFRAGRLRRNDPCREVGREHWRTLDELFPLLKYDSSEVATSFSGARQESALKISDVPHAGVRPLTSALKAGWVCFGIALSVSWFFPLGNAFFSIAIITAVVAMCTHQVNRGLVLLLASFAGLALCMLIFFTLVVGVIGAAALPVIKRVNADITRLQKAQPQSLSQISAVNQQMPSVLSIMAPPAAPRSGYPANSSLSGLSASRSAAGDQEWQRALTGTRAAGEAENRAAADQAQRQRNVREAERQRDLTRAREEQAQRLQKSIDWWDAQVTSRRAEGRDWQWVAEQRDAAIRQKADFLRR